MDETIKHGQLIEVSFRIQMPNLTKVANMNKSYNSSIPKKRRQTRPNISNITARGTNINQNRR